GSEPGCKNRGHAHRTKGRLHEDEESTRTGYYIPMPHYRERKEARTSESPQLPLLRGNATDPTSVKTSSQDLRVCLRKPSAPSPPRKRHGHDFSE
ncbi:Uncharacterized protein DAT39_002006, partial [Clarias magur]